jgi:4-hydroxybenzoate polyprenyltransferase
MRPTMSSIPQEETGGSRSTPLAYLSCIRYSEVLVLQGSPLFGVAFALREPSIEKLALVTVFAFASVLLVAHIWTFNDWGGISADINDPNKSARVFSTKGVSPRGLLAFSFGLLLASLALFALLPLRTLLLAVGIAALGVVYSYPAFGAKSIPIVSSGPHLVGGTLHFLLGYSVLSSIDGHGVLIALFFGLTFTAGHLNQEVRDYDGDRSNGLRTNAVAFGRTATFLAGLGVFTLAYADLACLAYAGVVPALLGVPPLVLYPVQVAWSVSTLREGLTFATVSRLQSRYRLLFGLIGLSMAVVLLSR